MAWSTWKEYNYWNPMNLNVCLPIGWVVCWLFGLSVCRDNLHFHAPIGAVVLNRSQSIKIITLEFLWMNKIDNIITSKKLLWNYKTCSFRFAEFKKNKTLFYFFHLLKPNAIAVKMMAIIVDIMRLSTSSAPYSK